MKKILKRIGEMFPSSIDGVATLIIYPDESGMIIRLGGKNLDIGIYDIRTNRLLEFDSVEDLMEQLK